MKEFRSLEFLEDTECVDQGRSISEDAVLQRGLIIIGDKEIPVWWVVAGANSGQTKLGAPISDAPFQNHLTEFGTSYRGVTGDRLPVILALGSDGNSRAVMTTPCPSSESTKTIAELLKMEFHVPFYQRGYRWRTNEVEQLLVDIDENTRNGISIYCLQPVVVARIEDGGAWELIDGQQRITTLNLLLAALDPECKPPIPIRYARSPRETDSASTGSGGNEVDAHFMGEASRCIREWIGTHKSDPDTRKIFNTQVLKQTTVIWHEVASDAAASEFLLFNAGRIPLSPCELLKARFLSHAGGARRSTAEIAAEWDQMESAFRDNAFWFFLNPGPELREAPNRIALLFDLLFPGNHNAELPGSVYLKNLPSAATPDQIEERWLSLQQCFLTLREWFADRETRHRIGFLRWSRSRKSSPTLNDLWEVFEKRGRRPFRDWLTAEIKDLLLPNEKCDTKQWEAASYENSGDRPYLHDVLLWLNLATLPPGTDYPFARHAAVRSWSLEHIHAQSAPEKASEAQVKHWRADCTTLLERLLRDGSAEAGEQETGRYERAQRLVERFEKVDPTKRPEEDEEFAKELNVLASEFESLLPDPITQDQDKLWNLALLPSGQNSSLSNRFFHAKREKILKFEAEAESEFVPPATVRVFLKAFSNEPGDLMLWTASDASAYRRRIEQALEAIRND